MIILVTVSECSWDFTSRSRHTSITDMLDNRVSDESPRLKWETRCPCPVLNVLLGQSTQHLRIKMRMVRLAFSRDARTLTICVCAPFVLTVAQTTGLIWLFLRLVQTCKRSISVPQVPLGPFHSDDRRVENALCLFDTGYF